MAKKVKKAVEVAVEEVEEARVIVEEKVEEQPKKKTYYNPTAAKAYRDRIKEFAKAGGYVPKERAPGSGQTIKKTSKAGTTYYYQPWSTLTDDQKAKRLAQARERMARERADAAAYRKEHETEQK